MAARVQLTSGFSRRYTGGVREFTVEAKNLHGVIKAMDRLYPGLGEHLEEETTVAIDGAIHETAYFQPIREGCEIFFIPKLEGGYPRPFPCARLRPYSLLRRDSAKLAPLSLLKSSRVPSGSATKRA